MAQHIFTGTGEPTWAPNAVGQHYIDTQNGKSYISTDIKDKNSWKLTDVITDHKKLANVGTSTHEEIEQSISGLQSGKENAGKAAQLIAQHEALNDPHPQYTTLIEATAASLVQSVNGKTGTVTLSKSDISLANVDNTSDFNKPVSTATQTALNLKINSSEKGAPNGVATLDSTGFVPASQLPSYVDDVVEYANLAAFPGTGSNGKIYVAQDSGKIYRWSGSSYVVISASPGSTDAVPEGAVNLYYTSARAASAAPVQDINGRVGSVVLSKGDVGLSNVDNTSDLDKPISNATQLALDGKENAIPSGDVTKFLRGDKTWAAIPSGGSSNPSYEQVLFDDFVSSTYYSTLEWNTTAASGVLTANGPLTHLNTSGIVTLSTGTSSTGRVALYLGNQSTVFGNGYRYTKCFVQIPVRSASTQRFVATVGYGDSGAVSGAPTDGIYFSHIDTENSGNWTCYTAKGGIRTRINSGVAVDITKYQRLDIEVMADASLVNFYIDGSWVGQITTNIPNGLTNQTGPLFKIEKSGGTTARTMAVDYFHSVWNPTVSR